MLELLVKQYKKEGKVLTYKVSKKNECEEERVEREEFCKVDLTFLPHERDRRKV